VRKKRSALFVKLEVLYAENNLATGVTLFAEFMRTPRFGKWQKAVDGRPDLA